MHMLDCLWGTASVRNRTKAIFTSKLRQTVQKRTIAGLDVRRASGDPVWACPARTCLERVCARFWADLASHALSKVRSGKSHNHQGFVMLRFLFSGPSSSQAEGGIWDWLAAGIERRSRGT